MIKLETEVRHFLKQTEDMNMKKMLICEEGGTRHLLSFLSNYSSFITLSLCVCISFLFQLLFSPHLLG